MKGSLSLGDPAMMRMIQSSEEGQLEYFLSCRGSQTLIAASRRIHIADPCTDLYNELSDMRNQVEEATHGL
jgi:hypothetical protein